MIDIERDKIFGKYKLLKKISEGSVASIYLARDGKKTIVLKIFEKIKYSDLIKKSYSTELSAIKNLKHKNIIKMYDFGYFNSSVPYIALEYMDGGTLEEIIHYSFPLNNMFTLRIIEQIASALDYAHGKGVIHRDIKTTNILLNKDLEVSKLCDFGIAKIIPSESPTLLGFSSVDGDDDNKITINNGSGTDDFMAPEILNEAPATNLSDIYSFSLVIYYMFSNKLPVKGSNMFTRCKARVEGKLIPLHERNPSISEELSYAVMRGLSLQPRKRYETASELSKQLHIAIYSPEDINFTNDDKKKEYIYYIIVPIVVAIIGAIATFLTNS